MTHVNLNNIMLKVFDFNKRAIKAYEKCGFKIFGVWKNSHYFNGEYIDENLKDYINIVFPLTFFYTLIIFSHFLKTFSDHHDIVYVIRFSHNI